MTIHIGSAVMLIVKMCLFRFSDPCVAFAAGVSQVVVEQGKGEGGKGFDDQVL